MDSLIFLNRHSGLLFFPENRVDDDHDHRTGQEDHGYWPLKNGGKRQNLEAKIFGGGRIIANMTDVGMRNIAFARDYLETEGLKITSEDVGDTFPRMVVYFPATGKVRVKRLRSLHANTIVEMETKYLQTIEEKPVSGDIELF